MFVGLGPYPLGSEAVSGRWYYYVLNCSIPSLCWRIAWRYGEKLDMEQTGSKQEKEFVKAVYCHPAYLTYMKRTSCESWAG